MPDTNVEVTLFPMLHIGEPQFYETVFSSALDHDAVLVEGVNSPVVRRITRAYQWVDGSKRLGLIVQPHLPSVRAGGAELIHADLAGEEFERHWRKVRLPMRLLIYAMAPLYALRLRWFGTRASIAKVHGLEDLTSRDDTLRWSADYAAMGDALLLARDDRLLDVMGRYLDRKSPTKRRLAIVYGAQHMRAVIRELSKRGFQAVKSDWMTVFST